MWAYMHELIQPARNCLSVGCVSDKEHLRVFLNEPTKVQKSAFNKSAMSILPRLYKYTSINIKSTQHSIKYSCFALGYCPQGIKNVLLLWFIHTTAVNLLHLFTHSITHSILTQFVQNVRNLSSL